MVASYSHMHQYMKVCRSLKPAEKSYSQFKIHKIEKKIKNALLWARTHGLKNHGPMPYPNLHRDFDNKMVVVTVYKLLPKTAMNWVS